MNARQKKKATTGKSPRLVERILGLPRGSCLDCVSFDRHGRVRSYHGARFTPMAAPLVTRPVVIRAEYERSEPWVGLDGKQHRVRRWRDANGEWQVFLDDKWVPPTMWDYWKNEPQRG